MKIKLGVGALAFLSVTVAVAQDHPGAQKDLSGNSVHAEAQKTMDRNMANAKEVTDKQAADRARAEMQPPPDGGIKVSDRVSVGGHIETGKNGAPTGGVATVTVHERDPNGNH